mmetsp:Transcript_86647/g.258578  ORF Transcript_86647/g.258578 Transcript_86647/m.258578 type:complete len:234 (+) Transcript_86647:259-960(+)
MRVPGPSAAARRSAKCSSSASGPAAASSRSSAASVQAAGVSVQCASVRPRAPPAARPASRTWTPGMLPGLSGGRRRAARSTAAMLRSSGRSVRTAPVTSSARSAVGPSSSATSTLCRRSCDKKNAELMMRQARSTRPLTRSSSENSPSGRMRLMGTTKRRAKQSPAPHKTAPWDSSCAGEAREDQRRVTRASRGSMGQVRAGAAARTCLGLPACLPGEGPPLLQAGWGVRSRA